MHSSCKTTFFLNLSPSCEHPVGLPHSAAFARRRGRADVVAPARPGQTICAGGRWGGTRICGVQGRGQRWDRRRPRAGHRVLGPSAQWGRLCQGGPELRRGRRLTQGCTLPSAVDSAAGFRVPHFPERFPPRQQPQGAVCQYDPDRGVGGPRSLEAAWGAWGVRDLSRLTPLPI
jgi:hypothetical protein